MAGAVDSAERPDIRKVSTHTVRTLLEGQRELYLCMVQLCDCTKYPQTTLPLPFSNELHKSLNTLYKRMLV